MTKVAAERTRADARRNRALVLAAARRAFAERGTGVSLTEIARAAGVGAGTVYRHFPAKSDLVEAVVHQRIDHLAAVAAKHATAADPGAAFFAVCRELVLTTPRAQELCEQVQSDDGWPKALVHSAGARFQREFGDLLAAAQRQGAVRADLDAADALAVVTGAIAVQRMQREPGISRPARVILDALYATETKPGDETGPSAAPESACPVCAQPVHRPATGRPARYCSPACRQRAHRRRRAAGPPER
ncbi:TetR/AcrR family transcriptional regulator [Nocardia sp. NPDC057227]|uniref:TetR/AcrR family transcriptional regulator n=1 Tax=Nocardia sp. NPDC057227 TaxID=3346056 RepID=UPI00362ACB79